MEMVVGKRSLARRRYKTGNVVDNLAEATELVHRYLEQTSSDFEPIVTAQAAVRDGVELPPVQLRIILNCMLADANVRNMPELPRKVFDAGAGGKPPMHNTVIWDDGEIQTDVHPLPVRVNLKSSFKKSLGLTLVSSALYIHALDSALSPTHWDRLAQKIYVNIKWLCKTSRQIQLRKVKLFTADEAQQFSRSSQGRYLPCPVCFEFAPDAFGRSSEYYC